MYLHFGREYYEHLKLAPCYFIPFSSLFLLTETSTFKVSRAYFQTAIENDSFILTLVSLNLKKAAERTKIGTKKRKNINIFIVVKQTKKTS